MPTARHIEDRLSAYLAGSMPFEERAQADSHLAACPQCSEERDLLREATALLSPIQIEPRQGFAAKVALEARKRRQLSPWGLGRWRWALGGLTAACLAAAALFVLRPQPAAEPSQELVLAQRLDLYEDMSVMQNQEALEDLEIVSVLHTLTPEAQP